LSSVVAVAAAPRAQAAGPVTLFSFTSAPGDFIGGGATRSYSPPSATITVGGFQSIINVDVTSGSDNWEIFFHAPTGSQLHAGSYTVAGRPPFYAPHPSVEMAGDGRACNNVFGSFTIYAISTDSDGQVTLLDATFTQRCENESAPPLTGVVKVRAPAAAPVIFSAENPNVVQYQPMTFAARVAQPAGGTVSFSDGGTVIGSSPVDATGFARLTVSNLALGAHSVTASYGAVTSAAVSTLVRDNDVSYWYTSVIGDSIGLGSTASFSSSDNGGDITFSGTLTSAQVSVFRDNDLLWIVNIGAPTGQVLHVGDITTTQDASSTSGRLYAFGDGRACDVTVGTLHITALQADDTGTLTQFAATFAQHCEGAAAPPLLGTINFHVTGPQSTLPGSVTPVSVTPGSIDFGAQRVGTFDPKGDRLVTITNPGTTSVRVTHIGLGGANPSDFFGATDCGIGVAGRLLAPGDSCHAVVNFGPLQRGARNAALVVLDNSGTPAHQVALRGTGTEGYLIAGAFGEVGTFGDAVYHGDATKLHLSAPMISLATTPNGAGYWLLGADGGIFSYGNAHFYGSTGNIRLNRPVVAMAASHDGKGYLLAASDGGIFAFGDARFYGSTGNIHLNQPIDGMAATADERGYWLVAADGGIFAFGDARFYGSAANAHLSSPVVQMEPTPTGHGYWILTGDGHIYGYGDAHTYGSATGHHTVSFATTPDGRGYWEVTNDGHVFPFGDAAAYGDVSSLGVSDVIGIAPTAPALPPALLRAASATASARANAADTRSSSATAFGSATADTGSSLTARADAIARARGLRTGGTH
jgi:hypothetical protein